MSDQATPAGSQWDPKITTTMSQAGWLRRLEDGLVCLALAALVLLPLAEIVLRATFKIGISGSNAVVQHMTLIIGMLGGAVAARENRLLGLSTGSAFLKGRLKSGAALFSGAVAATISIFLGVASYQFVLTEREAGSILAYSVPVWVIQSAMPIGFGLVAVRLLYHAGENWKLRALTAALTGLLTLLALRPPMSPAEAVTPALIGLLAATALGSPVFATLGGAALILFWGVLVPVLPLVFLVAPGSWRNVCPLAALNQGSRNLGISRAATPPGWFADYGYVIGTALLVGIVLGRNIWFNSTGAALATLLLAVGAGAAIGGWLLKGKSGWCGSF